LRANPPEVCREPWNTAGHRPSGAPLYLPIAVRLFVLVALACPSSSGVGGVANAPRWPTSTTARARHVSGAHWSGWPCWSASPIARPAASLALRRAAARHRGSTLRMGLRLRVSRRQSRPEPERAPRRVNRVPAGSRSSSRRRPVDVIHGFFWGARAKCQRQLIPGRPRRFRLRFCGPGFTTRARTASPRQKRGRAIAGASDTPLGARTQVNPPGSHRCTDSWAMRAPATSAASDRRQPNRRKPSH